MTNQETTFTFWAQPPSQTEQQRCENAEKAVRKAIQASNKLNQRNIKVFTHGSYRNRVNVRQNSDVDVGVLCYDSFFYDLPEGYTYESFGITLSNYHYQQFKNEVEEALVNYFGRAAVQRGSKAFDIKETSYQVEADVAPFFEHRRYEIGRSYWSGVELHTDNGNRIINWPEQHYDNAVSKNSITGRSFKGVVRILKRLAIHMEENNINSARNIPGFLIECMTYNVPNGYYGHPTWRQNVREILAFIYNNTLNDNDCAQWKEVSELKWLFHLTQKWNRQQAHDFVSAAWTYLGLS